MSELTLDQRTKVSNFIEIVHTDNKTSIDILKSCNWNLEEAISLQLAAMETSPMAPYTSTVDNNTHTHTHTHTHIPSGFPLPSLSRGGSFSAASRGSSYHSLLPPEHTTTVPLLRTDSLRSIASTTLQTVSSALTGVAHAIYWVGGSLLGLVGAMVWGPTVSDESFTYLFERKYGTRHPEFSTLSLREALRVARADRRLVAVYLHSHLAAATDAFLSQTLTNPTVIEMLTQHFIFVPLDTARRDGYETANRLDARRFPFIALMTENHNLQSLEGPITPDTFVALLTAAVIDLESHLERERQQAMRSENDRFLRESQDREYMEALAKDEALLEQKEKELEGHLVRKDKQQLKEMHRAKVEEERRAKSSEVLGLLNESSDKEPLTKICVRLPSGGRVERAFTCDASLGLVFEWLDCVHLFHAPPPSFVAPTEFELRQTFPPKSFVKDETRTLRELGLTPSAALLLQSIEDKDE
eukprot:GHVR01178808.1.p1 GENE.GHVR01178808.1~~GHVR01178808.1.p1  ORF type:complete len:471 (-),score=132.79 GHVR01178808.1:248-1660(-)